MKYPDSIWPPFTSLKSPVPSYRVTKAKKEYLYLENGSKLIDMISSWWVNLHGHSNKKIAKAIAKQARKMEHVIFAGFYHKPAQKLANCLLQESRYFEKVFFSDDGSTSVEVALKIAFMAKRLQGKHSIKFLAFENAYHGDTIGAMSVGGRSIFTETFSSLLFKTDYLPYPVSEKQKNKAKQKLKQLLVENEYAALIYEPLVQGAGGMQMARPEYLNEILEMAQRSGMYLIADEVMTGFYRTGTFLASEQMKTKPDIVCLSKGITGGFLPLAVTLVNSRITNFFKDEKITFYHGHSYTANPIACNAALASFRLLKKKKTLQKIQFLEQEFQKSTEVFSSFSCVKQARSKGGILAVELQSKTGGYLAKERNIIYSYFLKNGILARPLGNVIYYIPPYCISKKNLRYAIQVLENFLEEFSRKI